jgi:thiosulfate/3-mercaptopyruvate sulfurtransferase
MKYIVHYLALWVGINMMLFAVEIPPNHLVQTTWVNAHLNDPNIMLIDTRSVDAYKKGHIPHAVNIPKKMYFLGKLGSVKKLPSTPEQLQNIFQKAGIKEDTLLVFYSAGKNKVDFADAASGLWNSWLYGMHNVAILNGGYAKWLYEKREISKIIPTPHKSDLELDTYDNSAVASINDIFEAIYNDNLQIADARVGKFYRGEDKKKSLKRHGRIPTARLTPMIRYVHKKNTYFEFLEAKEAKDILYNNGFGVELDKPIYFYCNSGHKTRGIWFVAKFLIGLKNVKVYDGGMIEYSRSNMPISTGEPMD